jgi:hypothetical protein
MPTTCRPYTYTQLCNEDMYLKKIDPKNDPEIMYRCCKTKIIVVVNRVSIKAVSIETKTNSCLTERSMSNVLYRVKTIICIE